MIQPIEDVPSKEFEVVRVCPTRKKGHVKANVWVRYGGMDIQFKVVNGENGLFVGNPAAPVPWNGGKTRYVSRLKFNDPDLQKAIHETVLKAYRSHAKDGCYRVPEPLPKKPKPAKKPNRIKEMIEKAETIVDPDELASFLVQRSAGIIEDPDSTQREVLRALKVLFPVAVSGRERDIQTNKLVLDYKLALAKAYLASKNGQLTSDGRNEAKRPKTGRKRSRKSRKSDD